MCQTWVRGAVVGAGHVADLGPHLAALQRQAARLQEHDHADNDDRGKRGVLLFKDYQQSQASVCDAL